MRRSTTVAAAVLVLALGGVGVAGVLLQDGDADAGPAPDPSLDPAALLPVLCGLHEEQRDLSGYELASDDDHNALWDLQVVVSSRLSPEVAEAVDHADFAVGELDVGNEPNEESVEEGRSVVDDACAGVDGVEPDAGLFAGTGCLAARAVTTVEGARGSRAVWRTYVWFRAAAALDDEHDETARLAEEALYGDPVDGSDVREERVDRIVEGPCADG
ncbi:hypothetical protein [Nocardioides sp. TF02-7]|uniref:hypothetical protein n=1 Tax=Nocardioides sp. TF02-7 TaxID=2917724 RepID=UPI001F0586B5|nr:hypothetical protein [Nocardioides sp. TF02-7]UMG93232.1 hypothetical protein MF408_02745 [Nocardioides sp. TF02-7]